jgi:hypothetical protein
MPKAKSYTAAFRSGPSLPREPDNAVHLKKRQVYNQVRHAPAASALLLSLM